METLKPSKRQLIYEPEEFLRERQHQPRRVIQWSSLHHKLLYYIIQTFPPYLTPENPYFSFHGGDANIYKFLKKSNILFLFFLTCFYK